MSEEDSNKRLILSEEGEAIPAVPEDLPPPHIVVAASPIRKVPAKKAAKQRLLAAAAAQADMSMMDEDEEDEEEDENGERKKRLHGSNSSSGGGGSGAMGGGGGGKGKKGPETFEAELFAAQTVLDFMREFPHKSSEECTIFLKEALDAHFKQDFLLRAAAQRKRLVEVFALELHDASKQANRHDATTEQLEKIKYLESKYPESVRLVLVDLGNLLVQRLETAATLQGDAFKSGIAM